MRRSPIGKLAGMATVLARPDMKRRSYWRPLFGANHWMLVLITHGREGEPPEEPRTRPAPRISPEWLRRLGEGLAPGDLLYERILARFRAHTQDDEELAVHLAAFLAVEVVTDLVRSGEVDLSALVMEEAS